MYYFVYPETLKDGEFAGFSGFARAIFTTDAKPGTKDFDASLANCLTSFGVLKAFESQGHEYSTSVEVTNLGGRTIYTCIY